MEFILFGGTALGIIGFVFKKISRMRLKSKHRARLSQLSLQDAQPQQTVNHPSLQLASGALPRFQTQDYEQQQLNASTLPPLPPRSITNPRPLPLLLEDCSVPRSPLENAIASQHAALAQTRRN